MKKTICQIEIKLVFLCLLILPGCNYRQSDFKKTEAAELSNPADSTVEGPAANETVIDPAKKDADPAFENFYYKFHTDSAYQLNSIDFPLSGFNTDDESGTDTGTGNKEYFWEKDKWDLMKMPELDDNFSVEKTKTDSTYTEKISILNSGYYIIRVFKKRNEKWKLCFYGVHNL